MSRFTSPFIARDALKERDNMTMEQMVDIQKRAKVACERYLTSITPHLSSVGAVPGDIRDLALLLTKPSLKPTAILSQKDDKVDAAIQGFDIMGKHILSLRCGRMGTIIGLTEMNVINLYNAINNKEHDVAGYLLGYPETAITSFKNRQGLFYKELAHSNLVVEPWLWLSPFVPSLSNGGIVETQRLKEVEKALRKSLRQDLYMLINMAHKIDIVFTLCFHLEAIANNSASLQRGNSL
ncbi:MAG: hypothetical protein D6769_02680 [Methanobacteriota archaeon]|nr:MAG: hypothetical protein D6769_02680 [Euryarchaeota archaeon]